MAPIPFDAHPRRIVHDPDGRPALVAIRRTSGLWAPVRLPLPVVPVVAAVLALRRWLREDTRWTVELHRDVAEDWPAAGLPDTTWTWVEADRAAAVERAEEVCRRWQRGEVGPRHARG